MTDDFPTRIYNAWLDERVAAGDLPEAPRQTRFLGTGRLIFDSFDPPSLMRPRERNTWTGSIAMTPIGKAQIAFLIGRDPIPHIVEHDPQKLLPSPQHFGREPETFGQRFILDMAHSLGLTYDEIAADYEYEAPEPIRWKKAVIAVHDYSTGVAEAIKAVSAMSNVLAIDIDIQPSSGYLPPDLFMDSYKQLDAALRSIDMNARYREVRPNHQMRMYALGAMFDIPKVEPLAKQSHKSYLKHDPTKQHNRRRRRK